jgi:hypothetical protein
MLAGRRPATGAVRVVALVAMLIGIPAAHAIHRQAPGGMRVTSGSPHVLPPTRSWAYALAFPSAADLAGTGSTSRQVFVWNPRTFAQNLIRCRRTGACGTPRRPDLVQITENGRPGSPDNGSANDRYVTFDADGSYGGSGGGQAAHRQVFLYDRRTRGLVQVTSSDAGDSVKPSIDRASSAIVFESTAPLAGSGPAGVRQVFAALLPGLEIVRITAGAGPSGSPIPDRRAARVVFESTADLDGDGADTGTSQIFVATRNRKVDPRTFTIARVTYGDAASQHASIDEGGEVIVFDSAATNLDRGPLAVPGGTQVYRAHTGTAWIGGPDGDNPGLRQLTHRIPPPFDPLAAPDGDCVHPTIGTGGVHVSFVCTADFLANQTVGTRLFILDLSDGSLGQLTSQGDVSGPVAAVQRYLVAFAGDGDVSGTGACGTQIQALNFFTGRWDAATLPGQLPPDAFVGSPGPAPPASTMLAPHCNDGDPCSADRCDAVDGCIHEPVACGP